MEVYVFKTSVKRMQYEKMALVLNQEKSILKWNFDFDDCDNVLRIESDQNIEVFVCQLLQKIGHECVELNN